MHNKSLPELSAALKNREISSEELTRSFLDRIRRLDTTLNSFITVTEELALAQARAADKRIGAGQTGPLTGIPVAHKDIFCTHGVKTTCGSRMLDNFLAPYDATVIDRIRSAGMVMLGKTNMDEFAMGSSNETSYFGPVKNPWDETRVPGGSSGGSAAAVAARLAPIATGTDTGGSIRQPASFCNVTGIKPTYGRVSRYGMIAYASSLDQGGVIARSAEDAALLLGAMAGLDPRDSTSMDLPVPDYTASLSASLQGIKIGLPREWYGEGLDNEVRAVVEAALTSLTGLGVALVDIDLPHSPYCIPCYYVIAMSEASSNLSRYDGVRFGHRCQGPKNLLDLYTRSRAEGFGREVKRRIMAGTFSLSAGYYDAYYLKALKVRRLIAEDFRDAFRKVHLLAGPVAPTPAFALGEHLDDPVTMYLQDIYTLPLNLAGLPGMSIPAGFDGKGLPIGLQLIANHWQEERLFNVAHRYQQETGWHLHDKGK
uniref:Glutamyl-tRNA(Gln) amidotransferase subunit A n=1 Tax=Candidatus Kentrum sp. FM TaxID=2126340 RepID=A0A450TUU4_9GAMM|nr:MAG: aspartyl-tRNA(Asn)/glutamyl-tRNA(Gln) amidotransferase subunit A [Candidatus Kentron sp. FM]VFJ72780.1 MAG: aspartyl-tRNA(Asn)/glutamyl-tRNA(Gln) amidotransferase subunit A [Candidatus Kentron sp. FM]VFK09047.1 MAG: aspartyl-tRNA(Asn)/glutamyl-tRNA(Gln) amidotransferase subunit A [Candidatus Kentron sp. FM]